jgi:hypothetical protein
LLTSRNKFSAAIRSAAASSHFTISAATASRAAVSAGDGSIARGWSPPVRASASVAASTVRLQPEYVRLPNAMNPTPYSGSQRINVPKPGRPPLCDTIVGNWQFCDTRSPKP